LKRLLALFAIAVLISQLNINAVVAAQTSEEYRVLVLILPGVPLEVLVKNSSLKSVVESNNTVIHSVESKPPYTPLHYELILLNATWNSRKALALNDTVLTDSGVVEPWNVVNHTMINATWGQVETLFVNFKAVDPFQHARAVNPFYNYTARSIPSTLLTLPLNNTIYWPLLDTNVTLTLINGTYKITVEGYRRDVVFRNATLDTDLVLLNITRQDLKVPLGLYNVKFKIVEVNNTHAKVLMLGSRDYRDWYSKYFGLYVKNVLPRLPLEVLGELDFDNKVWVFKQVLEFYNESVKLGLRYRDAYVNLIEIPIYEDLAEAYSLGLINQTELAKLEEIFANATWSYIDVVQKTIGKCILVVLVPYVHVLKSSLFNLEIEGLEYTASGVYRVTGSVSEVVSKLAERNVKYEVVEVIGDKYVLTWYGDFKINGYGGYRSGYVVVNPVEYAVKYSNLILTPENIAGYLAALVNGYGAGATTLHKVIGDLKKRVSDLTFKVDQLNMTVNSLNATIQSLQRDLGECNAARLNFTGMLSDLKRELDEARKREVVWMTYAVAGTTSLLAIVILLYFIGSRVFVKRK